MGITLEMIEKMQGLTLFDSEHNKILDVGSSNIYNASRQKVNDFITGFGVPYSEKIDAFARKMEAGSSYDAVTGGANDAFVGELFEMAGMRYDAIDIADGYKTTILDMNHSHAPKHFINAFDLVMNFGTTEHLLNQYNAFKVIHDSCKWGGGGVYDSPVTLCRIFKSWVFHLHAPLYV